MLCVLGLTALLSRTEVDLPAASQRADGLNTREHFTVTNTKNCFQSSVDSENTLQAQLSDFLLAKYSSCDLIFTGPNLKMFSQ